MCRFTGWFWAECQEAHILGIISLVASMDHFPQFWTLIAVGFENVHVYNIYVRHTHTYLKLVLNVLVNQSEIFQNFLVAQVVPIS